MALDTLTGLVLNMHTNGVGKLPRTASNGSERGTASLGRVTTGLNAIDVSQLSSGMAYYSIDWKSTILQQGKLVILK